MPSVHCKSSGFCTPRQTSEAVNHQRHAFTSRGLRYSGARSTMTRVGLPSRSILALDSERLGQRLQKAMVLIVVLAPFLATGIAIEQLWDRAVSSSETSRYFSVSTSRSPWG
jgi:hypothetical protein